MTISAVTSNASFFQPQANTSTSSATQSVKTPSTASQTNAPDGDSPAVEAAESAATKAAEVAGGGVAKPQSPGSIINTKA